MRLSVGASERHLSRVILQIWKAKFNSATVEQDRPKVVMKGEGHFQLVLRFQVLLGELMRSLNIRLFEDELKFHGGFRVPAHRG